ncbi:MAG: M23 family metallopeptidase [Desulfuromonadaceae bacterium]|nr:M23 family metallopeptidase [Desulfuromonadaceae bacterium]MDD2856534.1 M23 family metallopeptidase [Desulfuromonadaceae bacterium]
MYSLIKKLIFFVICLTSTTVACAEEAIFSWPISCVPGVDCAGTHFRIGYPDVNGTGLSFSCSKPGYFGHQGTDIVVSSVEQNVHALAASNGVVRWTTDGKFDHCPSEGEKDCSLDEKSELQSGVTKGATLGFNAGNFVVIEHSSGESKYLTLYAHLRKDSITVTPGQKVSRGQYIGDVASSGNSQIPHLHFGVYKAEGALYRPVDPWKGACNTSSHGLWANAVPYRSGDLILAHPEQNISNSSEVYLQTIQRSLPKNLFN